MGPRLPALAWDGDPSNFWQKTQKALSLSRTVIFTILSLQFHLPVVLSIPSLRALMRRRARRDQRELCIFFADHCTLADISELRAKARRIRPRKRIDRALRDCICKRAP